MTVANTWRWLPNWEQGITERLEWRTDVQQGYDGTEQRYALRSIPRRSWSWEMLLTDAERQRFEVEFYANATATWLVPLWWDVSPASFAVGATTYTRPEFPDDRELPADGYLVIADSSGVIGKGPYIRTTGTIGGVPSVSYTWTGGLTRSFPAGRVYAARFAKVTITGKDNVTAGVTRYAFTAETTADFAVDPAAADNWPMRPDRAEPLPSSWEILQERIDYGGAWEYDVRRTQPLRGAEHRYILRSRADAYLLRARLAWLAGQYRTTNMPSFGDDLTPLGTINAGITMQVRRIGWTSSAPTKLAIIERDGFTTYRTVASSTIVGDAETLRIFPNITSAIALSGIRQICWAAPSRLATDAVEIVWTTPEVSTVALPWREVAE